MIQKIVRHDRSLCSFIYIFILDILCNMANVVICEFLLQNYIGKVPRSLLCTNVAGFYDEMEIVDAKNELFVAVSYMKLAFDNVPRKKLRKKENIET